MYGAVVERGIIRAADQKKYIVETLDRKGIESLQITALNGAPFAVGDIVYFFLFPDGTGKIICSEAANDTTGFVVDADYVHTDNNFTNEEKSKLEGIETKAQKNVQSDWNAESGDAFIKNKPTIPKKVSELEVDIPTVNLPVSVQNGGTGETTASQAAKNLGVLPLGEVVTKIPENADLNDYTIPGVYAVRNNSVAATIANIPQQNGGILRVFSGLGSDITASSTWKYLIQEYVVFNGRTHIREGSSGSGTTVTWDSWRAVVNSDDFPFSIARGGTGASSAAAARENLAVLPLAGGTVTGQVKSTYANPNGFLVEHGAADKDACFRATRSDTGVSVMMGVGSGGINHGVYSTKLGKWLIYGDGSNVYCNGTSTNVTGTVAVTHGGTGATTAAGARANLGVPTLLDVYPVGSIYMSVNSTSPATLFGGTWEQLKDRFLLAAGSTYSAGGTGGSATMAHTHTISHTHNLDSNGYAKMTLYSSGGDVSYREKSGVTAWTANFRVTGSGGAGSSTSLSSTYGAELGGRTAGSSAANTGAASNTDNMPPYLTVYMWKRTK